MNQRDLDRAAEAAVHTRNILAQDIATMTVALAKKREEWVRAADLADEAERLAASVRRADARVAA